MWSASFPVAGENKCRPYVKIKVRKERLGWRKQIYVKIKLRKRKVGVESYKRRLFAIIIILVNKKYIAS